MFQLLKTIKDSILDGGYIMIPLLILALVWAFAVTAEVFQRPLFKNLALHFLFPLGFVILAMIRVALGFHLFFDSLRITAVPLTEHGAP